MDMVRYNQLHDQSDPKDKSIKVLEEIDKWKKMKIKGSIVIHFDGSGRIARYQETTEGI